MPLQILNETLYHDRTVQDWHRRTMARDADAIDIDLMGVCHDFKCRDPLYIIEATTNPNKPATILRRLAEKSEAVGIVAVHNTETITGFRVVHDPFNLKSLQIASEDPETVFKYFLAVIRVYHKNKFHPAV